MFRTISEDIRVNAHWQDVPIARRLFGETGARVAACFLSIELQAVLLYRVQAWCSRKHIPIVPNICRRLTMVMCGFSVGHNTQIGPGLLLNHGHVIIDGRTKIGALCSIAPFVTIGLDTGGPDSSHAGPTIGRYVFVGTGAKILGGVTIGDNARIGANAVVMCDVPTNCTAVGVPARIIPHEHPLGPAVRATTETPTSPSPATKEPGAGG